MKANTATHCKRELRREGVRVLWLFNRNEFMFIEYE